MEAFLSNFGTYGDRLYKAFFEAERYMAYFNGFKTTLIISFFAVLIGVTLGIILALGKYASAGKKGLWPIRWICNIYITIIRSTPVYLQMLIINFIIFTSRDVPVLLSGIICFGLNSSAYVAEIIRAGIEAVDKGQTEAGRSLGLNGFTTMIYIIMPQAIKNILPALGNEFIVLIKETAIVGTISVLDVTKAAQNIGMVTYDVITPLLVTAAIYLVVVVVLIKLLGMFERRLARSDYR